MTHGNTPTRRCQQWRAVDLAFQELGDGQLAGALVVAGRQWRTDLTSGEVLAVLNRRPRHGIGEPKYVCKDGKWSRSESIRVTKAQLARENRGLDAFARERIAEEGRA